MEGNLYSLLFSLLLKSVSSFYHSSKKELNYLLAKKDRPEIDLVLKQFYDQSISLSQQWIKTGQEHEVIRSS